MKPSTYKPIYCDALIEHMDKGYSFSSFAAVADTCRTTLYEWTKENKDFALAKGRAEAKALLHWESIGIDAVNGKIENFAQATYIYTMKCRFRKYGYNEQAQMDDGEESANDLSTVPTEKLLKLIIK